ncbi:hypothetical protein YC2023_066271 [Brassica napus]
MTAAYVPLLKGSSLSVFDTMPRDVRDQCAGFRARPRFTPGFRGISPEIGSAGPKFRISFISLLSLCRMYESHLYEMAKSEGNFVEERIFRRLRRLAMLKICYSFVCRVSGLKCSRVCRCFAMLRRFSLRPAFEKHSGVFIVFCEVLAFRDLFRGFFRMFRLSFVTENLSYDFPRGLSANTHRTSVAICGSPSTHTGRPWLSVCVRQHTQDVHGCPSVHISARCTHRTSMGVCQHTQDVRVCPSAHTEHLCVSISTNRTSEAVRVCLCVSVSTHRTSVAVDHTHRTSVGVRQHTKVVRGCLWLSVSTHRTFVAVRVCLCVSVSTHRTSVGVRQHTQDVRGCPSAKTGCPCVSVSTHWTSMAVCVCLCVSVCVRQHTQDVRGCPSVHISARCTHRTSVGVHQHTQDVRGCPTHISTLVLGLSMLTLPVDCSGDFGLRWLSVQYTHDVGGCPPAHTRRLWLSVAVRQHTQDVRGCPCVSVSTHKTFVAVHQYTYQHVGPLTQHAGPSRGLFVYFGPCGLSVQYTQDVHGTDRTSGAVRVCPCVSVSTHRTSVAVHHTHRTSVGVRQDTQVVNGCLWLSVSTHMTSVAVRVCPCVTVSTHRTSVGVCQHTQDVRGCPSAQTGCPCVSVSTHRTSVAVCVCVRVCPSAHTGRLWLSISTHFSTLVLGLSTLALSVDCLDDFGPRGLSVQYTQDVRGGPPAHTGRLWLSVSTHMMSVAVRQHTHDVCGCPSAHTGRPWLSISTHICTLVLGLSMVALPVDCLDDFGQRVLYVHYTQDVHGCPPAHTGRTYLSVRTHRTSVAICSCMCVSVSTHTGRPWLSTHISLLVLGLSTLALPVDCLGDFGPRGLSVQYTQDVRQCPPAHTGRLWLSVSTHRTYVAVRSCLCVSLSTHTGRLWLSISTHISTLVLGLSMLALPVDCSGYLRPVALEIRQHTQDVCGCPCVSVSTHKTFVAVNQYTYQHVGPLTQHAGPSRGLFGTHRTSMGVSQHTQDVRVCPSAHTKHLCVSISTNKTSGALRVCPCVSVSTHRTSLAVHQYTYQHVDPWIQHAGPSRGLFGTQMTSVAVRVCPCVSVSTHKTSVGVCQHTQDVRGCPSAETGCPCLSVSTHWTSVAVCVCPCVSVITHRRSVVVHQYTYQHVVHTRRPWVSTSTHRTSVAVRQHTQDVCVCPSAHIEHLCVSISTNMTSGAVRVCPCVSVSTHRTSVAVHQYTYQHVGPWIQPAGPSRGLFGMHTGCLWLSISTHISTLVLGLSTLALPVDCSVDFGPRGLSVQYTHDVRGCPPAHTGRLWLSVGVRQHTQDVRGCLCVSVSTHKTFVAVHQPMWAVSSVHTGRPWLSVCVRVCPSAHTGRPTHRTSVGVCQHTQDVFVCPSANTERLCVSVSTNRTSGAIRVCPSAHTGRLWLSISTHSSTLVLGLSTLALPVECLGAFVPRGLFVQYTKDVSWCPPAHTGRPWLSVAVRPHTGRLWLSVCVRVCPSAHTGPHTGRLWLSISTHIGTFVLGLSMLTLPVDCLDDFGPRVLSVQYTQDVRGCPPAHTGRMCLSVSTHWTSGAVCSCLCVSVSTHTGRPWLSISTHISLLVLGLSTLVLLVDCLGDFGPRGLSVQYTQDVRECPPAHTGRLWLSVSTHRTYVAVRSWLCVSVSTHTGRLWLSISTHINKLVLGLSTLALPVDCLGDFGPSRGLFGLPKTGGIGK